jgi:hypothetical protein
MIVMMMSNVSDKKRRIESPVRQRSRVVRKKAGTVKGPPSTQGGVAHKINCSKRQHYMLLRAYVWLQVDKGLTQVATRRIVRNKRNLVGRSKSASSEQCILSNWDTQKYERYWNAVFRFWTERGAAICELLTVGRKECFYECGKFELNTEVQVTTSQK